MHWFNSQTELCITPSRLRWLKFILTFGNWNSSSLNDVKGSKWTNLENKNFNWVEWNRHNMLSGIMMTGNRTFVWLCFCWMCATFPHIPNYVSRERFFAISEKNVRLQCYRSVAISLHLLWLASKFECHVKRYILTFWVVAKVKRNKWLGWEFHRTNICLTQLQIRNEERKTRAIFFWKRRDVPIEVCLNVLLI